MSIEEMTKVQLINAIVTYEDHYKTIVGRLYAKNNDELRKLLYKLVKKVAVLGSILCVSCGHNDIYQEDEMDEDIFGLYVRCHKCGVRIRIKGV